MAVAKAIIERCAHGVFAKLVQRQDTGEWDFDLFRGDSKIGMVEVTQAADQGRRRDIAHIDDQDITCAELRHSWFITPRPRPLTDKKKRGGLPPINKIRQDLCSSLVELEKEGCFKFSADRFQRSATAKRLVEKLGIDYGVCFPDSPATGMVHLTYPSDDPAHRDPEYVLCAVQREMEKSDNCRKLRSGRDNNLAERHFFVMIDEISCWQPWYAMNNCPPPATGFQFDNDATHLWVAATNHGRSTDWIVWSTMPAGSWQHHEIKLNPDE